MNILKCADCGRPFSRPTGGNGMYCPSCKAMAMDRRGDSPTGYSHPTAAEIAAGVAGKDAVNEDRARTLIRQLSPEASAAIISVHRQMMLV